MTKEEFKFQFRRLCDGFNFEPTTGQIAAFYERLQMYDVRDWREAVTDLLCSPRFPKDITAILDVIGKRADDRRRIEAERSRMERISIPEPPTGTFPREGRSDDWDGCGFPPEIRKHLEQAGLISPRDGNA
jgi:hypothetical protein